jgi:hypothetical protein
LTVGVTSCDKDDESGGKFDGTYVHQSYSAYKIIIQGNSWTTKINDVNYGKGMYTLSGNTASGTSTYAWENNTWVVYTDDTFLGMFDESSNTFAITTMTGWDKNFIGTYKRQ